MINSIHEEWFNCTATNGDDDIKYDSIHIGNENLS